MKPSNDNQNPLAAKEIIPSPYLAQKVVNLKPSGIRKFFDIVATMKDVISLGIGEPDFTTPKPILEAGIESLRSGETHYTSNHGILELRRALSSHLERLYGIHYEPANELVITVGGSEALYLAATALLEPGQEVIIPTPCFVSYQAEVILAGGVPVEIPCRMEDNFDLDIAAIRQRHHAAHQGDPDQFPHQPDRGGILARKFTQTGADG